LPQLAVNHLLVLGGFANQVIFAATDGGVYFTENGGLGWERIGANMPVIPVYDIALDTINNRLIAGTFGRSMFSVGIDSLLIVTRLPGSPAEPDFFLETAVVSHTLHLRGPWVGRDCQLALFDSQGRVIRSKTSLQAMQLDVSALKPGVYFLKLWKENTFRTARFVKV
jgi:hypothetical protein